MSTAFAFLAGGLIAGALTPLAERLGRRFGVLSTSTADRWDPRSIPLLGGVALLAGTLIPALTLTPITRELAVVAVGTVASFALGLVDDIWHIRATSKIVGQILVASTLAIAGIQVQIIETQPIAFLLTLLWVVGMMNAINLSDNMDGLAAGLSAIAAFVLVLMAAPDLTWVRVAGAACAGACCGFLLRNFPPARIFMGDAGSQTLGFLLAALALVLTNEVASNVGLAVLGPLLALALPLFDTLLVTVTRSAQGRPISRGGRDHTSHRLASLGLGPRATILILYGVAGAFALLGLVANALGLAFVPLLALSAVGLILFGLFLADASSGGTAVTAGPSRLRGRARQLVRFGGEIGLDVVLASSALFIAYLVRFENVPAPVWTQLFAQAIPVVVPVQLAAYAALGVYRPLWRFVSATDLVTILRASFVGTLIAGLLMFYPLALVGHSRGALLIDAVLFAALAAASRLSLVWLRHWFAMRPRPGGRRVLIVGANETGELALRILMRSTTERYQPVGFLDDDIGTHRRRIHGVPVLGAVSELVAIASRERAELILIAGGEADQCRRVRESCESMGIEAREFARFV